MPHKRPRPQHLAAKLRRIRKSLGLTQPKLIERLNVDRISPPYICQYESGRTEPTLIVLLAYARLANVPVENLIDDDLALYL
jgi:transcriptional regulator with XRE-family HTH domain